MRDYYGKWQAQNIDAQYRGPTAVDIAKAYAGQQPPQQPEKKPPQQEDPQQQPQPQQQQPEGHSSNYGMFGGAFMGLGGGDGASQSAAMGLGGSQLASSLAGADSNTISALGGVLGPSVQRLIDQYPGFAGGAGLYFGR